MVALLLGGLLCLGKLVGAAVLLDSPIDSTEEKRGL
jgi:hypothetical protein